MRSGVRISFLTFALVLSAGVATAQSRDPSQADNLFKRAREATKQGDYASACRDFAESQRLDPAPGTLLNLGDCEEKRGLLASALRDYSEALLRLPNGDPRMTYATERVKNLGTRVPQLTVILAPGAPIGTKVTCADQELPAASLGTPAPLDPGEYTIVATPPGGPEQRVKLRIGEGESRSVTLDLSTGTSSAQQAALVPWSPTAPVSGPTSSSTPTKTSGGGRPLGFALGGIGLLGVAVGATTGVMALGAASTFKNGCPNNACVDQASLDAGHRAKTLGLVSTVGFAAGLAVLGVGTYLVLAAPKDAPASTIAKLTDVRIAPMAGGGVGGINISGGF